MGGCGRDIGGRLGDGYPKLGDSWVRRRNGSRARSAVPLFKPAPGPANTRDVHGRCADLHRRPARPCRRVGRVRSPPRSPGRRRPCVSTAISCHSRMRRRHAGRDARLQATRPRRYRQGRLEGDDSALLATLVAAGVDIIKALEISGTTAGNWVVESAVVGVRAKVH